MPKSNNTLNVSQKASREWEAYKKRSKVRAIRKGFDLLHSKAYLSLRYSPAYMVLDWFLEKRRVRRINKRRGKGGWQTVNNGEISFPYEEARCRGLSDQQFSWALKRLHAVGFIDVTEPGSGMMGSYTKYALSERWREFGARDFKHVEFPKSNYIGYRRPKQTKSNGEQSLLVSSENSLLVSLEKNKNDQMSLSKGATFP